MTARKLEGTCTLLRIFVGEDQHVRHRSLYLEILAHARRLSVAGCTVVRGIAGFGASSVIHQDHLFKVSRDLPIIIEIVDGQDMIDRLLEVVRPLLSGAGALVTQERVEVLHYVHNGHASVGAAAAP